MLCPHHLGVLKWEILGRALITEKHCIYLSCSKPYPPFFTVMRILIYKTNFMFYSSNETINSCCRSSKPRAFFSINSTCAHCTTLQRMLVLDTKPHLRVFLFCSIAAFTKVKNLNPSSAAFHVFLYINPLKPV